MYEVAPAVVSTDQCPELIREASWFEATVASHEQVTRWVVDCSIEGADGSGKVVFEGSMPAGNYMGGIELDPGQTTTFRSFTFALDGSGFTKAPPSASAFTADCEPWDWGSYGPPTCLVTGTMVATPSGPVAVEDIRSGTLVWSFDDAGRPIAVPVREVGKARVPAWHRVVHLELSDGRTLTASPGHPLADGRTLGSLQVGDAVDGAYVVSAVLVGYAEPFTFDLLPGGPTGTYVADGVPLLSTLREER
jgi:hypothetical protein